MNNSKKIVLCLSVVLFVACQSEAPSEAAKECPKATECPEASEGEAPKVAAQAAPAAPAEKVAAAEAPEVLVPGEPSKFAGLIVPAGVDWFGAVDMRALKGTVVERQFRPWLRYLDGIPEYKKFMVDVGAGELLGHTVVMGGTFAPHTALGFDVVGAVFGLESAAKMSEWVTAQIAEKGPPPAREFKIGHPDGGPAWFAGPSITASAEAILDGKGESVNDDDAWVELQRSINTKAYVWALVKIPELIRAQFPLLHAEVPGLQYFPGVMEVLGMTHAAASIDLGDRLEIRFAVKLQSDEDALVVKEQLELAAEATLWDPSLFFDVFQLQSNGSLVSFTAATSEKVWRVSVFWLSIAAQGVALDEMRQSRWEEQMMKEEAEKRDEWAKEKAMRAVLESDEVKKDENLK